MMKKVEISVIMPVYNAELFLAESLESILNQTFTNFELICVNDRSNDLSTEILLKYQDLDDRIKILTNNIRQGAAETRNRGMRAAIGTYFVFLDADDIFEKDMLELAFNAIEKYQSDIVMFEAMHMPTEKIHETIKKKHTEKYKEKYCRKTFSLKECEPWEIVNWTSAPWNKMYRRSFIESKKIYFQSLPCNNDVYFVIMGYMSDSKIIVLDEERNLVHVRDHYSVSRISYDRDPMCSYKAIKKIQEELIERDLFKDVYAHFYYRAFFEFIGAIKSAQSREKAQKFYDFLSYEGIRQICENHETYYAQSDEYIQNAFEKFRKKSFESRWYLEEGALKINIEKRKDFLLNYIRAVVDSGNKICIWGAGRNGRILINFLNDNAVKIDCILDMNTEKEGTYIGGYQIKRPEYLSYKAEKEYLVFVTSVWALDSASILAQKSTNKISVVGIHELLNI